LPELLRSRRAGDDEAEPSAPHPLEECPSPAERCAGVRISLGSDAHGPRELLNFMAADDLVAWAAAVRERHFR